MDKPHIKGVAGLLLALAWVAPVLAFSIAIDGAFTDWSGQPDVAVVSDVVADDWASPTNTDITQFGSAFDSSGLYLLMAWDDTAFTGGNACTAGVTLICGDGSHFRIYTTAQGSPGSVPLTSLIVEKCTDSTCKKATPVCTGTGCAGVALASGTSLVDPWAGRSAPACSNTPACGNYDTAVELSLPWALTCGTMPVNPITLNFGSYPSGPAEAPKDTPSNWIRCDPVTGECEEYNPTAVKLLAFTGRPAAQAIVLQWETASEEDNAGFNLYRREVGATALVRVNDTLIPSRAPGQGQGAGYELVDANVTAGMTYEYLLEDVDLSGERGQHGPVTVKAPYAVLLPLLFR